MGEKKTIVLNNGEQFPVIKEEKRFWICKNTKFRKGSSQIKEIKISKIKNAQEKGGITNAYC